MAKSPKTFDKYGLSWPADWDDLQIELFCIKNGGQWIQDGVTVGIGLFNHFKNAQTLCWPEDDHHRWSDLVLRGIVENEITILMGPSDSNKTYSMVRWALIDWWADPERTLHMISSTDVRGLELRVWGKLKELLNRAKDRFDYLPGQVLESMHSITPDKISPGNERGRLLQRGLVCIPCIVGNRYVGMGRMIGVKSPRLRHIGDECFPSGTLVDTPFGPKPIETIKIGDLVMSAIGPSIVEATMSKRSESMLRIHLRDGRSITCTPNHPFLTQKGWKKACEIGQDSYMVSVYESMQILQVGNRIGQGVLQQVLSREVVYYDAGGQGQVLHQGTWQEDRPSQAGNAPSAARVGRGTAAKIAQYEHGDENFKWEKGVRGTQEEWLATPNSRGEWNRTFRSGVYADGLVSRWCMELWHQDWKMEREWLSSGLQGGHWVSSPEVGHRGRRRLPQHFQSKIPRREERNLSKGAWVDSVEILQQEDLAGFDANKDGVRVYNLQVLGHPSYSVSGLLAHNCQFMAGSFLTSYSNWYGKGDFKGLMAGNPIDVLDPLGKAAEPQEGWAAHPAPAKTTTWRSTFFNAFVINLVGTDSPNFDYPKDEPARYDYLVGHKKLEAVAKTYGKDSMEWSSQCEGVMRPGLVGKRVITREMCRIHHAHDEAVWAGTKRTKVYACDPAFGGGDRCVGGMLEFGLGLDGRDILCVHEPEIIPVSVKIDKEPEDQIAEHVKMRLDEFEIPYENAGYDSFGGGKLGFAFAQLFGYSPPVPVDSGSKPTKRPVRYDLFVKLDGSPWIGGPEEKRLKLCSEEYSKFVTEMWFSVAEIIKGNQMRELPQEVMLEGCLREYRTVLGNKTELETKDKTKERMGKSPDLFDWLAVGVEMARRKGFRILRLGVEPESEKVEDETDNLYDEQQAILASKLLRRAA
jgi:hypothetical protein